MAQAHQVFEQVNLDMVEDIGRVAGFTRHPSPTQLSLDLLVNDFQHGSVSLLIPSLKELIETVTDLAMREIELKSLKENIDTTTPTGKFMFYIMAALTEFERDLISKRTLAGLEAVRGRKGGRPSVTRNMSVANLEQARALYASQKMSVKDIRNIWPADAGSAG